MEEAGDALVRDPQPTSPPHPAWMAVRSGQPKALEALFVRWMPVALQWCRRLGGPRVDADQAAQEVFMVVLRKVAQVESEAAFPRWLFAVTRRVLAQQRRSAWPNRWDPSSPIESATAVSSGVAVQEAHERRRLVWEALESMPQEQREILTLCDIEGRTDPEAADILGIPVGTAKSRLRRARYTFSNRARNRGLAPPDGPNAAGDEELP